MTTQQTVARIEEKVDTLDARFLELIDSIQEHDNRLGHVAAHVGDDADMQRDYDSLAAETNELKRLKETLFHALDTDDMDTAVQLISRGLTSARALEADFGRVWLKIQEHDSRLDAYDSRIERLEQLLEEGHDIDLAASMAGIDSDELCTILHLDPDTDLTEVDVTRAIVDWMRRTDSVAREAHQRITAVEQSSSDVNSRVDRLQTTVTEIRETSSQSDSSSGATIVALIAGVIAFLLALWFVNSRTDDPFWIRFGASLGFAAIVAGAFLAVASFSGSSSKSTSESSTQSSETDEPSGSQPPRRGFRDSIRQGRNQAREQSTSTDQAQVRAESDNPRGSSDSDDRTRVLTTVSH